MEAKLTKEDQVELAKLGMMEYLTSGITANFDMYLNNTCHAKASTELGFRTVLCGSMNDFGGTVPETEEEYYRLNDYSPLVSYKLGFHAEYTTKRALMEELAQLAGKMKEPVYLHLAEKYDLLYTCGSDYHGPVIKPDIALGTGISNNLGICDEKIPERLSAAIAAKCSA